MIVTAIKTKKFLWLASKAAKWVSLNIQVDPVKKTWIIRSKPIWNPQYQIRYYEDIANIFKSKPETFKVTEKRVDGKFKSFTVET